MKIELYVQMIVQRVLFPTVVVLYLYKLKELRFSILKKKFNSGKNFLKIKNSILCEKFMKMKIYVPMMVQNVLFPTMVDL